MHKYLYIVLATTGLLISSSVEMVQDARRKLDTFENGETRLGDIPLRCAEPSGPFSQPNRIITRNPDVWPFAIEACGEAYLRPHVEPF
jgi:hypothetical protein